MTSRPLMTGAATGAWLVARSVALVLAVAGIVTAACALVVLREPVTNDA